MRYAICQTAKIKSSTDMMQRYFHNERIYNVRNADPEKGSLNEHLIDTNGQSYEDIFQETLRRHQMEGSITKSLRKDAVRGIEILLSYSNRPDLPEMDVDTWKKECVEWLNETFNPPGNSYTYTDKDGNVRQGQTDNVRAAYLHMDEHSPHIHALVIPVDDKGHINARYYLGNRTKMQEIQNSYHKKIEHHGIKRGVPGSSATHRQISKYYNELLAPLEVKLPQVMPGESALDYQERAEEVYQRAMVQAHDRERALKQEVREAGRAGAEKEQIFTKKISVIKKTLGVSSLDERELVRVALNAKENESFKTAMADHPDREMAKQAQEAYDRLLAWQMGREDKKKKKSQDINL